MVIKRCLVFSLVLVGFFSKGVSQEKLWDWNDKGYVPESKESSFKDFVSNKTPYPVKPKNAWEFSIGGGPSFVIGDVKAKMGLGGSLTLRKAINNTFSYRLGYFGSLNYGIGGTYNYSPNSNSVPGFSTTTAFKTNDYLNKSHSFACDLIASINTFSNYRGDPKSNLYLLGGLGIVASKTRFFDPKTASWHWLKAFPRQGLLSPTKPYNGSYGANKPTAWFGAFSYGIGYAYKINRKINIAIEERLTTPILNYDYIDAYSGVNSSKDTYYFTALKINYNLIK